MVADWNKLAHYLRQDGNSQQPNNLIKKSKNYSDWVHLVKLVPKSTGLEPARPVPVQSVKKLNLNVHSNSSAQQKIISQLKKERNIICFLHGNFFFKMEIAKQEQYAKFQPFQQTSNFSVQGPTFTRPNYWINKFHSLISLYEDLVLLVV